MRSLTSVIATFDNPQTHFSRNFRGSAAPLQHWDHKRNCNLCNHKAKCYVAFIEILVPDGTRPCGCSGQSEPRIAVELVRAKMPKAPTTPKMVRRCKKM